MGPCLCGDECCSSCGPLQGNFQCPICRKWTSEGGCEDVFACGAENVNLGYWERIDDHIEKAYETRTLKKSEYKRIMAFYIMRSKHEVFFFSPPPYIEYILEGLVRIVED